MLAMTKLKGWAHQEVDRFGVKSSLPQAIADNQMDYWNCIWKLGSGIQDPRGD